MRDSLSSRASRTVVPQSTLIISFIIYLTFYSISLFIDLPFFYSSPLFSSRENELSLVSFPLLSARRKHGMLQAVDLDGVGGGKAV